MAGSESAFTILADADANTRGRCRPCDVSASRTRQFQPVVDSRRSPIVEDELTLGRAQLLQREPDRIRDRRQSADSWLRDGEPIETAVHLDGFGDDAEQHNGERIAARTDSHQTESIPGSVRT